MQICFDNWPIIRGASDPLSKFEESLRYNDKAETWVAYALSEKPRGNFDLGDSAKVQMTMAVLTAPEVPFALFMGISRSLTFIVEGGHAHRGIATMLQGFAAKVLRMLDNSKLYVITTPLEKMREILSAALPAGSIWIGVNNDSSPITTTGTSNYDEDFSFTLKDKMGVEIFKVSRKTGLQNIAWFFANTQPSYSHPYVTVDLSALEANFNKPPR